MLLKLVDDENAAGEDSVLAPAKGSILVFMPGVAEIFRLMRLVEEAFEDFGVSARYVSVMALHGALSPNDQAKVFRSSPKGTIKIVIATNVAEVTLKL